jgi:hypothetical protein
LTDCGAFERMGEPTACLKREEWADGAGLWKSNESYSRPPGGPRCRSCRSAAVCQSLASRAAATMGASLMPAEEAPIAGRARTSDRTCRPASTRAKPPSVAIVYAGNPRSSPELRLRSADFPTGGWAGREERRNAPYRVVVGGCDQNDRPGGLHLAIGLENSSRKAHAQQIHQIRPVAGGLLYEDRGLGSLTPD